MKHDSSFIILCSLLFIPFGVRAQSLTLDGCKQAAHDNYPAIKQYSLIEKSRDLNVSNAAKAWLPGVNVTGFGAAFTDVLNTSLQTSAMLGDMKNYIVGGAVNVTQAIYDGGAISANKETMRAKADVDMKQMDVSMYGINECIEQLYFGILMLDEQIHQNKLLQSDLGISEKTVQSMIKGGLANQSDLDAVNVRQLQCQQQEIALNGTRRTYLNMLGYFTGKNLTESASLSRPSNIEASISDDASNRPELSLYASQERLLDTQRKALDTRLMPTVGAFGIGTYHSVPLPLMKSNTLAAGLMVKWNIGALYTRKNDIANIENQREQISTLRETFLFNNKMQNKQSNGTIDNLRKQMALDDKAVALRESIREKSEKKVKNGTETVNELLRNVNAVSEAKQQKAIHEIQLLQEIYKLKLTNNN